MRKKAMTAVTLTILVFLAALPAAAEDWELLGEKTVERRAERDEIVVTGKEGTFSKIKLRVRVAGVEFKDVKVHFGNGEIHDVELRRAIPAGSETREIDLPGKRRVIRKVVFLYKTRPGVKRRAVVTLWGRH